MTTTFHHIEDEFLDNLLKRISVLIGFKTATTTSPARVTRLFQIIKSRPYWVAILEVNE